MRGAAHPPDRQTVNYELWYTDLSVKYSFLIFWSQRQVESINVVYVDFQTKKLRICQPDGCEIIENCINK